VVKKFLWELKWKAIEKVYDGEFFLYIKEVLLLALPSKQQEFPA
jgi:hypothetical protein